MWPDAAGRCSAAVVDKRNGAFRPLYKVTQQGLYRVKMWSKVYG